MVPQKPEKLHQGPVRSKKSGSMVTRDYLVLLVWRCKLVPRGSCAYPLKAYCWYISMRKKSILLLLQVVMLARGGRPHPYEIYHLVALFVSAIRAELSELNNFSFKNRARFKSGFSRLSRGDLNRSGT